MNMRAYLALFSLVCLPACNQDRLARLEKENAELRAQLAKVPNNASLELQNKCAKQARSEFTAQGYNHVKAEDSAEFTNHYNLKHNMCFMEVTLVDMVKGKGGDYIFVTHRFLTDAFEGKLYGEYHWATQKDKKYWEVAPSLCTVTPVGQQQTTCHSTDEYDSLIKQFMEQ